MTVQMELTSADGFTLSAYVAEPQGAPRGAIVVLQEIFGVNHHMRDVTDRFAADGYLAIAPSMFDRLERGIELGYDAGGMAKGRGYAQRLEHDETMADIQAAIEAASRGGQVGVVGYCWGGSFAFAAACQLSGLAAAVGYYGGTIVEMKDEMPQVPTMLHFGSRDAHIRLGDIEAIKAARPEIPVHIFEAGHGFNCDERDSYDKESAHVARQLTLQFLAKHLVSSASRAGTGVQN